MKNNRVVLNIGADLTKPPEPDLPMVSIDGVAIENVKGVRIDATVDAYTTIVLIFHADIGGFVGQNNVEELINKAGK